MVSIVAITVNFNTNVCVCVCVRERERETDSMVSIVAITVTKGTRCSRFTFHGIINQLITRKQCSSQYPSITTGWTG